MTVLDRGRLSALLKDAEADDGAAANALLLEIMQAGDAEFAALSYEALKDVMQIASLVAEAADPAHLIAVFSRCLGAMQNIGLPAAEYILPLFNLRVSHLKAGANDRANQLLDELVEAAKHSGAVSAPTARALMELVPAFQEHGYHESAAELYRPVWLTFVESDESGWETRVASTGLFSRLLTTANRSGAAVEVLGHVLAQLDEHQPAADADYRMTLQTMMAQACDASGETDAAEAAHIHAVAAAERSSDPDSREAGILYHNLGGWWFKQGNTEQFPRAIELTERAVRISERIGVSKNPIEYAASRGQLGGLRACVGQIDEACADFDACFAAFAQAADANPEDIADYRMDEGKAMLDAQVLDRAAHAFQCAKQLRLEAGDDLPANLEAWIGATAFELGNFTAANEAHREVIRAQTTMRLKRR